ncbi:MAG TPA: hypothetical protein VFK44_04785 [Bacillales bacterium]|nr:hypothetical protein [Bacillales bacterium]
MNKMQGIGFVLLAGLFSVVLLKTIYNPLMDLIHPKAAVDLSKPVLLRPGDYLVGKNESVKPGFYDIKALEGKPAFDKVQLSEADQLLGWHLKKNTHVLIEGKGTVQLLPATYEPLSIKANDTYMIHHSGFYKIGEQIRAGTYKLSCTNKAGEKLDQKPLIKIMPGYEETARSAYSFINKSSYTIVLKKGDLLEIHKSLFNEYDHVVIQLKRID